MGVEPSRLPQARYKINNHRSKTNFLLRQSGKEPLSEMPINKGTPRQKPPSRQSLSEHRKEKKNYKKKKIHLRRRRTFPSRDVSADRSNGTALPLTTPRRVLPSSADDSAPARHARSRRREAGTATDYAVPGCSDSKRPGRRGARPRLGMPHDGAGDTSSHT